MKFSDQGIVISQKKYGENSLIIKVFSKEHGVYRAFVKSVRSTKSKVIFQIGNLISFEYRARNEDNLGQFYGADLVKSYCSKIMFEQLKLDCVNAIFSIIDSGFLEREEHQVFFGALQNFLQNLATQDQQNLFLAEYVKLEVSLLEALGYGLDLSSCVATNSKDNLAFVSPKSGRAVSVEAAKPYENKLLKLPNFLINNEQKICNEDLLQGLKLSGFFLQKFIFDGQELKVNYRENLRNKILKY